jgi:phosphomevalonate kinase
LAQLCHCAAQGKIGSGFDVSAAVYGSHKYSRFSPEILTPLLNEKVSELKDISSKWLLKVLNAEILLETIKKSWDNSVKRFTLPKGMTLILGDVNQGSNTPNMVSKVLKWKAESTGGIHPSLVM